MEGFTGIKDLDKELMLSMGDREFIQTCGLNTYFRNICKDQYLFKKKLERSYPDTLKPEIYVKYGRMISWKNYYAEVVKTISLLREKYQFNYTKGNPFFHLSILNYVFDSISKYPYRSILYYGSVNVELPLIEYAIEKEPGIIGKTQLESAAGFKNPTILKYMVEHGGDVNLLRGTDFSKFSPASMQYLKNLGIEN